MSRTLRLHVTEIHSQFQWKWRLRDDQGLDLRAEVDLDATRHEHQQLVDRPRESARGVDPVARAQLRTALAEVLGPDLVRELTDASVSEVQLRVNPVGRVALTLPLEVLWDDPSTIVVRQLPPVADDPAYQHDGVLAGFTLCPGDDYLCLHEEARLIQQAAAEGGHAVEEMFVAFTGDEFLARGRGRTVVHLAGHGSGLAMRCPRRVGDEQALTAREMVEAWSDAPPGLIVLNFCESSSEREVSRLLSPALRDSVALYAYEARLVAAEDVALGSMALDLAAGMATAVIAMRTPIHDVAAREFATRLYQEYLGRGVPLREAFRRALQVNCPVDRSGVPVPVLFLSTRHEPHAEPGGATLGPPDDRERRYVNYLYNGFAAWAQLAERRWLGSVTGWDRDVRRYLLARLTRPTVHGVPHVEPVTDMSVFVFGGASGTEAAAVGFDTDSVPTSVPAREVAAHLAIDRPSDQLLLADATCQVPSIVEALSEVPLEAVIASLRAIELGRSPLLDRSVRWDVARALIEFLPDDRRRAVLEWSDAKWARLEALGPLAIDVAAARFLLGDDFYFSDRLHEMLIPMGKARGLALEGLGQVLADIAVAEIGSTSVDVATGSYPTVISIDLLTASRAWAHCADEAAASYTASYVDARTAFLGGRDAADAVGTMDLVVLAQLCLATRDQRLWPLLEVLRRRRTDSLAERLAEAAATARFVRDEPDRDGRPEWEPVVEHLHHGRVSAALRAVEALEGSPAFDSLDVRAARLMLADPGDDPRRALEQANALIDEVLSALGDSHADAQGPLTLLNGLRQVAAVAVDALGDPDAATAMLTRHWNEANALGGEVTQRVLAGGLLAQRLHAGGRLAEARELVDVLLSLSAHMPPSVSRCWPLALDLGLLALEQRLGRIPGAMDELTESLNAWESPRLDILSLCLSALGSGELALDRGGRGLAWMALADYVLFGERPLDRAKAAAHASAVFGATVEDTREASRAIEALMAALIHRVAADKPAFCEFLETWLSAWTPRTDIDILRAALGDEHAAALRARAEAGCTFARLAVRSLAETAGADLDFGLPDDWDPASLATIRTDHPPLGLLLGKMITERFTAVTPILREAHAGALDARIEHFGGLLGHFRAVGAQDGGIVEVAARLGRGESWPDVADLLRGLRGQALIMAAVLGEECLCAGVPVTAATDSMREIAVTTWTAMLEHAHADRASAEAIWLALDFALGAAAAQDLARHGRLPPEVERVGGGPAERVANAFAANVRGRIALGVAALDRHSATGDRDAILHEIEALAQRAEEAEPGGRDWSGALQQASAAAMRISELDRAIELEHAVAYSPPHSDQAQRFFETILASNFNLLALLVAAERFDEVAEHFETLCAHFGASVGSWAAERLALSPPEAVQRRMAASLSADRPDRLAESWRDARERLLAAIADEPAWEAAVAYLRRSLKT